jgi:hypothetical protein
MNGKQAKKIRKYARQMYTEHRENYRRQMSGSLWEDFFYVVSKLNLRSRIRLAMMIIRGKRIGK